MSETASEGADGGSENTADVVTDTFVDEATVRDRVWDATLDLIQRRPIPFQAWRVRKRAGLGKEHDRTIRRTLTVMAEAGWLDHEDNSPWWHLGEKAKQHFDADSAV